MTPEAVANTDEQVTDVDSSFVNPGIAAQLRDAIWLGSAALTEIEYVNPAFEKLWGRTAAEVYDSPQILLEGVHPDDRDRLQMVIAEEREDWIVDVRVVRPDGSERRVEVCGFSAASKSGAESQGGSCRDITDRLDSQAALAQSEALLVEACRLQGLGGWARDADSLDTVWTKPLFDLFELPEGKAPPWQDQVNFIHPDDRSMHTVAVQDGLTKGVPFDLELRATTANGKPLHVRLTGQPVSVNGKVVRLWGFFQDITERVEDQEALVKSAALLVETGRMARLGGWENDVEKSEVVWTESLFDLLELPYDKTPPVEYRNSFIVPEDRSRHRAAVQEALDNGVPFDLELRVVTAKGNPLHVRNIGYPMVVDGATVRLSGFLQDITERVENKAALAKSESLFSTILQTAPDSIILVDEHGIVTSWNESSTEMFGYSQEEALGRSLTDLIVPARHQVACLRDLGRVKTSDEAAAPYSILEVDARRSDGSEFPVEIAISWTDGPEARFAIGIIRDVSERTIQAERLRAAFVATIEAMVRAIETRDPYTAAHQRNVSQLAAAIAQGLGLRQEDVNAVLFGSMIHDIGKIAVPSQILNKPGRLNEIEFRMVKGHSQVGFDIVSEIEYPWPVAEIVLQHHERLDGSGYPNALRGDEISQLAQIVCVADVVEAMTAHRPYRPALGVEVALEEITKNRGILYDPDVVDVCVRLIREENFEFDESER